MEANFEIFKKAKDIFQKYEESYKNNTESYAQVFGEEEILLNRDEMLRSMLRLCRIDTNLIDDIESNWIESEKTRYDEMKDEIWNTIEKMINGNKGAHEIYRSFSQMLSVRKSKGESLRRIEKLSFDFLTNILSSLFDNNDKLRKAASSDVEKDNAILRQENEHLKLSMEELTRKCGDSKKRESNLMEMLENTGQTKGNEPRKKSLHVKFLL